MEENQINMEDIQANIAELEQALIELSEQISPEALEQLLVTDSFKYVIKIFIDAQGQELLDNILSGLNFKNPIAKDMIVAFMKGIINKYLNPITIVNIKKLNSDTIIPTQASVLSSGYDIYAPQDYHFGPGVTEIVKTGFSVEIPAGYELQIRPRSGLSAKTSLRVANAPGTIDADYRDEVGVILHNAGLKFVDIKKGDRIAQMVLQKVPTMKLVEVEELDKSEDRGGGFGSTGE